MRTQPYSSTKSAPRRDDSGYSSLLIVPGVLMMCVGLPLMASFVVFFLISFIPAGIGVVLFGGGMMLVWASGTPIAAKVVATCFPFAAIASAFGVFHLITRTEPTTFLVPEGYRGDIAVVFNESCAPPLPRENGRRIVALAADGIAIAPDFETNRMWGVLSLNAEYVLVDLAGHRLGPIHVGEYPYMDPHPDPAEMERLRVVHENRPTGYGGEVGDLYIGFTYQTAHVGTEITMTAEGNAPLEVQKEGEPPEPDPVALRVLACRRAAGQPDAGIPPPSDGDLL